MPGAAKGWGGSTYYRTLLTLSLFHSYHSIHFPVLSILQFGLYADAGHIHFGNTPILYPGEGLCSDGLL